MKMKAVTDFPGLHLLHHLTTQKSCISRPSTAKGQLLTEVYVDCGWLMVICRLQHQILFIVVD